MVALLCYHKNLTQLYPKEWVDDYRSSILLQTFKDFTIFECNYGGGEERIFKNIYHQILPQNHFVSIEMPTFVHALNYLLDMAFNAGFTCVANTNVDDLYMRNFLEIEVPFIESGEYDIVSSNFSLKYEKPIVKPPKYHYFDKLNIKKELEKNHNCVGHPSVLYSRKFLGKNRYIPEEQPYEDMNLWLRTIDNYKFKIVPEHLFIHRIHDQAVCRSENK